MPNEQSPSPSRPKLTISLDFRVISLILLLLLAGLVMYTQPWKQAASGETRKITISGQATIAAEPDEFTFSPSWERATLDEISSLNDTIVAELKKLGVADKDIKNNATAWEDYQTLMVAPAEPGQPDKTINRQLTITIVVDNKELAQKVQDYLLTTDPIGSITPYPQFSTEKQKQLEDQARTEAIADAKKRAETTATGLDAKVGKVLEVGENQGGGVYPIAYDTMSSTDGGAERSSLSVQPGENEFNYTVQVVFELQ